MAFAKFGLVLILTLAFVLACINFASMNERFLWFPSAVVIYGIEPIRELFPIASSPSKAELATIGSNHNNFNKYQVAKYNLGCYGANEYFDGNVEENNTIFEKKLHELEYAATKFDAKSVCTCIDVMLWDVKNNGVTSNKDDFSSNSDEAWHIALSEKQYNGFSNRKDLDTDLDSAKMKSKFDAHVLEFCALSAEPVHSIKYEGAINAGVYMFVGQFFLIASIFYEMAKDQDETSFKWVTIVSNARNMFKEVTSPKGSMYKNVYIVAGQVLVIAGTVIFFVYSMHHTNATKEKDIAFRSDSHTSFTSGDPISIFFVLVFVLLLVDQLFAAAIHFYKSTNSTNDMLEKIIAQYFNIEILNVLGWCLLIVSLAVQAKKKDLDTLTIIILLIVVVGIIRYISCCLRKVYEEVCTHLSKDVIKELQTEKNVSAPNKNTRQFLRFVGTIRLFAFLTTLVLSVCLIFVCNVTTEDSYRQNTAEGRFLFLIITFLLTHISIDLLLEMVPLQFEPNEAEKQHSFVYNIKYYILALYLLFLNVSVFSSWRHEIYFHADAA